MLDYLQLKRIIWSWLAALWCTSAWAAQETFAHDLTAIAPGAVAVALALAFIGGLAYTTQKIAKPDVVVASIPLEVFKDLINALVSGLCAFFLGSWMGLPLFGQALLITIAGYGGSRFLEQLLAETLSRIGALVGALIKPATKE